MKELTKSTTIGAVITVFAILLSMSTAAQDVEPNDNIATASALALNGSESGDLAIDPTNDFSDYYAVVLDDNGSLTASVAFELGLSGRIYFYLKNGTLLGTSGIVAGPETAEFTANCLAEDTVYVRVFRSNGSGNYTVSNLFSPAGLVNDSEPNASIATANVFLSPEDQVTGHLGYSGVGISDNSDYYGLIAGDDGNITVSAVFDSTLTGQLVFYYKNGQFLSQTSVKTGDITLSRSCLAQDTVYLNTVRSSGCGAYSLSFTTDTPPAHDQDIEPNNSIPTVSTFIEDGGTVDGRMGYVGFGISDSQDYYGLILPDDGNITVSGTFDSTMTGQLLFYYKNGQFLSQTAVKTGELELSLSCMAEDTVYLRTSQSSGCGSYSLTFTTNTPPSHDQDMEPNNAIASVSTFLEDGETVDGRMGYIGFGISDSQDYYGLVLPDDGNITVSGTFDSTMTGQLLFYYKNGQFLSQTAVKTGEMELSRSCLAQDTVFLRTSISSGCGSYSLVFTTNTPPPHDQDIEPNNSVSTASAFIEDGGTVDGRMGYVGFGISDSQDYYGLLLPDDGNITVSGLFDSTMTGQLLFYYKNGQFLSQTTVKTGELELSLSCVAQDTIYLRTSVSSGCGSYTLTFTTNTPPPHEQDIEPNNSIPTVSTFIEDGETVDGRMGYVGFGINDSEDYYGLVLPDDGNITVSGVFDSTMTGQLLFYYKNGQFLTQTTVKTGELELSLSCLAQDTVYLRTSRSSGCGSYSLQYGHAYPTYSQDTEPNDAVGTATAIENAPLYEGHLGYNGLGISDNADHYRFTVTEAPFELDAKVEMVDGLIGTLTLYNGAGSFIAQTTTQTGSFSYQQTITTAGEYVIRVGRTSGCGSYTLGDLCGEYPAIPTISADGPLAFCDGESVNLTASPETSYKWNTGETTQSINVTTTGEYTVRVKDVNGCPAESATTSVTVYPLPDIPIITNGGPDIFCEGESTTLSCSPEASYLWSTGETTQDIDVFDSGEYFVTVTDINECSATSDPYGITVEPNSIYYLDNDNDGYGDPNNPFEYCELLPGYADNDLDCDDDDDQVNPDGIEECDGVDNDCNGQVDDGLEETWYADTDGDGFGDPNNSLEDCSQPEGYVADNTDCDDEDENIFIGASCDDGEVSTINDVYGEDCVCAGEQSDTEGDALTCADGIDNDGDGLIDCEDPACQALRSGLGCETCFSDGLSFADVVLGYDDVCPSNNADHPQGAIGAPDYAGTGATERFVSLGNAGALYLGFTNNTLTNSGTADPDLWVFEIGPAVEGSFIELRPLDQATIDILTNAGIQDVDEDGYYEMGAIGGSTASLDIDAVLPGLNPLEVLFDAIKILDDGGSCSGSTPGADIDAVCALSSLECVPGTPCDDFDECTIEDVLDVNCNCSGELLDSDDDGTPDCEDGCPFDENYVAPPIWYADNDDDGYGDGENSLESCDQPEGYVENALDCDDDDDMINPDGVEVCDGVDNDCDGEIDEEGGSSWYADTDGDGFGDASDEIVACAQPEGYVDNALDCDDDDDTINPDGVEVCDGVDNDCDGEIDEEGGSSWYADTDGDGFGDASDEIVACDQPEGYVGNALDCDDEDEEVNPEADEICGNEIDDNCDGEVDEDCDDCSAFETAPVDLSKSMRPVPWPNGVIDRVQLKWYKASPQIKYTSEDNAACDIEYWPVQLIVSPGHHIPIPLEEQDTTLIPYTKVKKDNGNPLFKWPVKFLDGQGNNPVEPNMSYRWRVRCYCQQGALIDSVQIITPWSALKALNTPDFDPETGIYTPPNGAFSGEDQTKLLDLEELNIKIYPNPTDGSRLVLEFEDKIDRVSLVELIDLTGKIIHAEQIGPSKNQVRALDFSNTALKKGIYLINVIQDNRIYRDRIIVK